MYKKEILKLSFDSVIRDLGYRVVKLKYFILVVIALLLQVIAVALFLLNSRDVVDFELFSTSILFGATSSIIILLAVGVLILLKIDKSRDLNKIKLLSEFKRDHQRIKVKYISDISRITRVFDNEMKDFDLKIELAVKLVKLFDSFYEDLSMMKVPSFLKDAHKYVSRHLICERSFYQEFSMLASKDDLEKYVIQAGDAHRSYLEEMDKLERYLKITI
jgi:hypothetical protein